MIARNKTEALTQIHENIRKFGWHVYVVIGDPCPRWVYTVGCFEKLGAELVFAGGAFYSADQIKQIVNQIAALSIQAGQYDTISTFNLGELGNFRLRRVVNSWAELLLLGAMDYFKKTEMSAWQIVPDEEHDTIDTPSLWLEFDPTINLPWQWLTVPWPYTAPATATATTNLPALRREVITEVMRWEVDEWEIFAGAGPEIPKHEVRIVPLGTIIAADPSLVIVANLEIGKGLWRDQADMQWHDWG